MHLRPFALAALLAAAALPSAAQSPASGPAVLARPVVDAESAWAAAVQSCKAEAAAALITEDFTFTDYNGMTYSRAWFLKRVRACAHTLVRIEPMHVSLHDGDRAALVLSKYHQFAGAEPVDIHHLTHVLVKEDGAWKVAHHHSNVMRAGAGPATGKAFVQLTGGPSTKEPEGFTPTVARFDGPLGPPLSGSPILREKDVMDAAFTYASAFQNCQTPRVDRLLAKNYLITGFNGMTYTRAWMIDGTEECYHDLQRIDPLQLRLYGENTALLLGRYHQFVNNRAADLRHLTMLLVREGGEWRVAFHHSTTFNENVGSAEGKLFYNEGGDSTLNSIPYPNRVKAQKR